jgi:pyridoxal phosphate enzyme (YggS family)
MQVFGQATAVGVSALAAAPNGAPWAATLRSSADRRRPCAEPVTAIRAVVCPWCVLVTVHAMISEIQQRYQAVRARITQAALQASRNPDDVQLLAVSKTFAAEQVREVAALGQRDFGENYVQEGVDKIAALKDLPGLVWHCIGPLQSNKTRPVAEHFDWVHSVDRLKIAQRLSEQRPAHLPPLNICLQVNIDGGPTKAGVSPTDALALARAVVALPRLVLRGLMTIPDPVEGFDAQLAIHMLAKHVFDDLHASLGLPQFDALSMGMSADLEAAVQAGSTMVRVGTAVFGAR